MRDYLVFQLHGPLAAWGDIAVGETRPSDLAPSKSAVLGLIAAALGLRRPDTTGDEALQRQWDAGYVALAGGYGMAVKLTRPGLPLIDYHTAQVPTVGKGKNKKVFATRKDELGWLPRHELNTVLSRRDYRQDAYSAVALWARERAPYPLGLLRDKLLAPEFALYLGRKSCPPALPLHPSLVASESIEDAMADYSFAAAATLIWGKESPVAKQLRKKMAEENPMLFWDIDAETRIPVDRQGTYTRRDVPTSRRRWQFAVREERRGHPIPGGRE